MLSSRAVVASDASNRYAKQLAAHFGRKLPVEEVQGPDGGALLRFPFGEALVVDSPGQLVLRATAPDAASLDRLQTVLTSHLERFSSRSPLRVQWQMAAGTTR